MNPSITAEQLAIALSKSTRTIDRSISKLNELGMLVRIGSKQTGHWKIIKYKINETILSIRYSHFGLHLLIK